MDLDEQSIITYMPDTNCFRYRGYILQKLKEGIEESNDQKQRRAYKKAAIRFWDKIFDEAEKEKADIIVSSEVVQEIKVQSYTLDKKENKPINKLLNIFDKETIEATIVPNHLEDELREFSNYIRHRYGSLIVPPGYKTDYLRVSDARILVHSYLNDAVLATGNIKDFLLYTLFFEHKEDKLYDILSGQFVKIPFDGREKVYEDEMFQSLLSNMREFKGL